MSARAKLDKLRTTVRIAEGRFAEHDIAMSAKYGSGYPDRWLSSAEYKTRSKLRAAVNKTGDAVMAHIAALSPRDWSFGVPAAWVRDELSYEDAVRPVDEPLSVVPPLSFGAVRPRT